MDLTYEGYFILYLLNRFQGERSVSAVLHLLRGKRTSQTIQDGFLFKVHPYFQTMPHITRQDLDRIMAELVKKEWVKEQDADHYVLTRQGVMCLNDLRETYHIPTGLNGWFYGGSAKAFWNRLALLVQTISYLDAGNARFHPVTRDEGTLKWVKQFLLSIGLNRHDLLKALHEELEIALNKLPMIEANLLTYRLSGFQCDGLSVPQLSEATGKSKTEILLLLLSGIHRTVQLINAVEEFNLLKPLLGQNKMTGLTESAGKTRELLISGKTLEDIARYRHLKMTTVQDHIVEMAFCDPAFSITPFVKEDIYQVVADALEKAQSKKLSLIKQQCPDHVQYFHIRLVLARECLT